MPTWPSRRTLVTLYTDAAREIREALEGKTPQAFRDDTASMSVTLNIEVVRKKLFGDDE
jgi:hypothetical protein